MPTGVMKMRPVEGGLEITPGETVTLKPSGLHVMLMDLKHALKQGKMSACGEADQGICDGMSAAGESGRGIPSCIRRSPASCPGLGKSELSLLARFEVLN
jgi:hypothetical protein